jgi:ammonia channel protein AmtB
MIKALSFSITSLTHWNKALIKKPIVIQLVTRPTAFYGKLSFFTVVTKALHWPVSQLNSVQALISYFFKMHFNIILPAIISLVTAKKLKYSANLHNTGLAVIEIKHAYSKLASSVMVKIL